MENNRKPSNLFARIDDDSIMVSLDNGMYTTYPLDNAHIWLAHAIQRPQEFNVTIRNQRKDAGVYYTGTENFVREAVPEQVQAVRESIQKLIYKVAEDTVEIAAGGDFTPFQDSTVAVDRETIVNHLVYNIMESGMVPEVFQAALKEKREISSVTCDSSTFYIDFVPGHLEKYADMPYNRQGIPDSLQAILDDTRERYMNAAREVVLSVIWKEVECELDENGVLQLDDWDTMQALDNMMDQPDEVSLNALVDIWREMPEITDVDRGGGKILIAFSETMLQYHRAAHYAVESSIDWLNDYYRSTGDVTEQLRLDRGKLAELKLSDIFREAGIEIKGEMSSHNPAVAKLDWFLNKRPEVADFDFQDEFLMVQIKPEHLAYCHPLDKPDYPVPPRMGR